VEVTGKVERLRELCDRTRAVGEAFGRVLSGKVGFVPTMGALHEGHLSLLRRARDESDLVVLSVYVNPLQFGEGEDYQEYPRDLEADAELAEKEKVDVVFTPDDRLMYPEGEPPTVVDPGPMGDVLEGASRPGHFRGVCTVVSKLFNMVGPCTAYFGEKDIQQLAIIRMMVRDLSFPVDVEGCPTVREPDGLATSSRNAFLSEEERPAATCLYRALTRASEVVAQGERDANAVKAEMARVIGAEPLARIDYVAVVAEGTLEEVDRVEPAGEWRLSVVAEGRAEETSRTMLPHARALVAARVGKIRLIDNMALP
jgi:pantoate--beta-alanine ligase